MLLFRHLVQVGKTFLREIAIHGYKTFSTEQTATLAQEPLCAVAFYKRLRAELVVSSR